MKVLLDTNILLAIVPKRSKVRWCYDALREGKYGVVLFSRTVAKRQF